MSIRNYKLGSKLGQGTFAIVYEALDTNTQERVAIKMLEKDKITSDRDKLRFKNECHILKEIKHNNLIELFEIIEDDNYFYIVMEYVIGGELFDFIDTNKRLSDQKARNLFHQLIDVVETLHSHGAIHRDLKPENILMRDDEEIVLIDFGLSMLIQKNQLLLTPCGSPSYAAPEMLEGKAYDGRKTDTWSCGVILYAMLCGYLPFDEENTKELYLKIKACDYVLPNGLSEQAKDFISRILTNPENRMSIQDMKQHPWWSMNGPSEIIMDDDEFDFGLEEIQEIQDQQSCLEEEIQQRSYQSTIISHKSAKQSVNKRHLVRELKFGQNFQTLEQAYQIIFDSQRVKQSVLKSERVHSPPKSLISKPAMKINSNKKTSAQKVNKYSKYL